MNQTLRDQLLRGHIDPEFRNELLRSVRVQRTGFGFCVLFFGALTAGQVAYGALHGGPWVSGPPMSSVAGLIIAWMMWTRFRDRVAMLESMEDSEDSEQQAGVPAIPQP